jgi:hypothetical protein
MRVSNAQIMKRSSNACCADRGKGR